jgi:hypothetical protein
MDINMQIPNTKFEGLTWLCIKITFFSKEMPCKHFVGAYLPHHTTSEQRRRNINVDCCVNIKIFDGICQPFSIDFRIAVTTSTISD